MSKDKASWIAEFIDLESEGYFMGLFDFFKRKKEPSKQDFYENLFREMAQKSPSEYFVSVNLIHFVQLNRASIENAIRSDDIWGLHMMFIKGYLRYLDDPQYIHGVPGIVNKERNDTDPRNWNLSIKTLRNQDKAILYYMPIKNPQLSGRIAGIVLGSRGDGYFYCMLNKDERVLSEVVRNKHMESKERNETAGAVKGSGFELMDSFVDCIMKNYYA